jgi:simple sugar transport system permease protein
MSSSVATQPSSQPSPPPASPGAPAGPVRQQRSLLGRTLARPEIGALAAAVVIFLFFYAVAPTFRTLPAASTYLYASATIGIVAVGVALLMIGGEFDLSAGVAVTTSALCASLVSYQLSLNVWVGVLVSLLLALAIGFLNGYLVTRTGIPSFLVTLSTFFVLQGVNLGLTKLITGAVATPDISQLDGFSSARAIFASNVDLGFMTINVTVLWWLAFMIVGTWLLLRTRVGNWVFAAGGNQASARAVGVPVRRVKIGLFMGVGFLAWFLGMHLLMNFNTVQAGLGVGNEFIYIIAAVVGGALLTGGYGSAVGSALGAVIFGMTTQGIVFAGWDPNWFKTFLGVMLLGAVLVNLYIKNYAERRK